MLGGVVDERPEQNSLSQEIQSLRERIADLERYQQQYINLFEYAGDSIFIIDGSTYRIVDVNSNAMRRFGYTREDLLQLTLDDLEVLPDASSEINSTLWESSFSGTTVYQCYYRHKSGKLIPVEVSSRVVTTDGQAIIQTWVRDISERQNLEDQRLSLILERERMQILTKFISQASHEFRTPLSNIQTRVYLLKQLIEDQQQIQHINLIEHQADTINELVDAMITMCQIDRANPDFMMTNIDVNDVVTAASQSLHAEANAKEIRQDVHLCEEKLYTHSNFRYLKIAVRHILNNAIQHTSPDDGVTIRTYRIDDQIGIDIIDHGEGIEPKSLPHIFEHFYRADEAGTKRGFGLGLPIAKAIIDLHDGEIRVTSELGQGSTFSIILPAQPR